MDLLGLGESRWNAAKGRDYLWALMIATVGSRPLGIQATELAAVARIWSSRGSGPVSVVADGPRASIMALVAAGLKERAFRGLELYGSLGSLKELIEKKAIYNNSPELFCFGLLQDFDVAQLVAMVAPRPVVFADPSDRAKVELASLKAFYAALGRTLDPLKPVNPTSTSQ